MGKLKTKMRVTEDDRDWSLQQSTSAFVWDFQDGYKLMHVKIKALRFGKVSSPFIWKLKKIYNIYLHLTKLRRCHFVE